MPSTIRDQTVDEEKALLGLTAKILLENSGKTVEQMNDLARTLCPYFFRTIRYPLSFNRLNLSDSTAPMALTLPYQQGPRFEVTVIPERSKRLRERFLYETLVEDLQILNEAYMRSLKERLTETVEANERLERLPKA